MFGLLVFLSYVISSAKLRSNPSQKPDARSQKKKEPR